MLCIAYANQIFSGGTREFYIACVNQIWLGGTPNQTTLAKCFMNKVKIQDMEKVLEPLFYSWKHKRQQGESFGSFTTRMVRNNPILTVH